MPRAKKTGVRKPKLSDLFQKGQLPESIKNFKTTYFSAAQIATITGMSQATVLRAMKAGTIKSISTPGGHWRVPAHLLKAYIDETGIIPGKVALDLVDLINKNDA